MPVLEHSTYLPPWGFSNGHVQTIFPALFRRVPWLTQERERLELPDGDFLDLDWCRNYSTNRLAILTHGLEGEARNHYIQGMVSALHRRGWDVLVWTLRGCGEPNRLLRSYHSGATEDLKAVVDHALAAGRHSHIALVGFSIGGNLTLKYLGDLGSDIDSRIKRAVAFSVPCDLASSSLELEKPSNRLYMKRFMNTLRVKIRGKMLMFPGKLSDEDLDAMQTFREFDDAYTAPLHGFLNARDYWTRASSKPVLPHIRIPTLLVSARNDPFLPAACFPVEEAEGNDFLLLEMPASGGHLGFVSFCSGKEYWSETRTADFLSMDFPGGS